MKKITAVFMLIISAKSFSQNWKTDDQYIQKFAAYAVEEMEKYNIPASITLAQGLLETGGGQSKLAREGNNHFGIKCKNDWAGRTMSHTDDAPNECFRVYDNPKQSYEDHSKFLAYRPYYKALFELDPKDYKAWAFGLKKAGYATESRYAYILISKIEKYHLDEFDKTNSKEVLHTLLKMYPDLRSDKIFMAQLEQSQANTAPATVKVPYEPVSYAKQQQNVEKIKTNAELLNAILVKNHPNGGRKFFIAPADTDIDFLSKKFAVSSHKIMKWNELSSTSITKNSIIFLEPKASSGNMETYRAKVGETMYEISQKFGMKLSKLYSKNRMSFGEQPKAGQLIYLQNKKPRK